MGRQHEGEAVPAGFRLRADPGLRVLAGGAVLAGGSPLRVLRLSPAGASAVVGWLEGEPVSESPAARRLARKLLDTGMAHPVLAGGPSPDDVTVVIPVRDRPAQLARCLRGLNDLRVIVVDDGSADPAGTAAVVALSDRRRQMPVQVIYRERNGGPAAARNTGLAAATTPLIAFLDSDCVPEPGWLDNLLPHTADPATGVVAPRIVPHQDGRGWLARYEDTSSTLDMGIRPSIVRPGARVTYVPGAALLVLREAAGTGFDEELRVGEDVDFVWRLADSGWRVRYEPSALMGHQHRVRLRPWLSRRRDYGTSAAVLELRHPGSVRPLRISGWTTAAWIAALSGRRAAAAGITVAAAGLLARRLARVLARPPGRSMTHRPPSKAVDESSTTCLTAVALAARVAGGGTLGAVRPIGSALTRTWLPLAVPAAIASRRLRVPLVALALTPPLLDWLERHPPLDPIRYVAARLLDDAAYSAGVWQGCARWRTIRPLLPAISGPALRRQPVRAAEQERHVPQ